MIFLHVSAVADIEMNLPFAVQRPLKFQENERKCISGLRREREVILGLGVGRWLSTLF